MSLCMYIRTLLSRILTVIGSVINIDVVCKYVHINTKQIHTIKTNRLFLIANKGKDEHFDNNSHRNGEVSYKPLVVINVCTYVYIRITHFCIPCKATYSIRTYVQ